jgi:hypothetical protein
MSIGELHALLYPAARHAIRAFGTTRAGDPRAGHLLDWAEILIALHDAGLVKPGPSRGRTSFWYLTWRFEASGRAVLTQVLGRSWSVAAYRLIWRPAVVGPRIRQRYSSTPIAPAPQYAFRLLDEPTPWKTRPPRRRLRSMAAHVPDRWRTIARDRPTLTTGRGSIGLALPP